MMSSPVLSAFIFIISLSPLSEKSSAALSSLVVVWSCDNWVLQGFKSKEKEVYDKILKSLQGEEIDTNH